MTCGHAGNAIHTRMPQDCGISHSVSYFFTFTVTMAFFFPEVTVIFAFPAFLPLTTPFAETVATFLSEVLYVTLSWESDGVITGLSVSFGIDVLSVFPQTAHVRV